MTSMGWFTTNWRSAYVFAIDAMETCMHCFWFMLLHVEDIPGITLGEVVALLARVSTRNGMHTCIERCIMQVKPYLLHAARG
jgi:hypothetical protein